VTLAIAVATADGIVVAADSRTTGQLPDAPRRVISDFTHKVFATSGSAVATYGYAFLLQRNIAGHMAEFTREIVERGGVGPEALATALGTFFGERLESHFAVGNDPRPAEGDTVLGFLVGGYENGIGALYEVALPSSEVQRLADTTTGGAAWRGQTDVVARLIKGIDLDCAIRTADDEIRNQLMTLMPTFAKVEYVVPFNSMNLQDGIDFAVLAIRTTIDVQRLTHGTAGAPGSWPGVGGPIEIATVLPTGGVNWVQQTQLQGERGAGVAELG